jgi:hypothetical protein
MKQYLLISIILLAVNNNLLSFIYNNKICVRKSSINLQASKTLDIVPPNYITDDIDAKKPNYIECIIEYYNENNDLLIESWLFHINAIIEDMSENKPSFLRFLYLNKYILGKTKSISCTSWGYLVNKFCIECIKLFSGNVYNHGLLVPIYNENNNQPLTARECMNINVNQTFYLMNNININVFCKTHIFSFL